MVFVFLFLTYFTLYGSNLSTQFFNHSRTQSFIYQITSEKILKARMGTYIEIFCSQGSSILRDVKSLLLNGKGQTIAILSITNFFWTKVSWDKIVTDS